MNKSKILQGLGITGAGIGIGYVIFQAYKHYKVDQAKAMAEAEVFIKEQEKKMEESDPLGEEEDEIVKVNDSTKSEEKWIDYLKAEDMVRPVEPKLIPVDNRVYNLTKGVDTLRHDADSLEAFEQYRHMILSDFELDPDQHGILNRLFNYTISIVNRRDMILGERICEDRTRFFGKDSKFIHDITMAEVLIFYANKLSEDIGMDLLEAMKLILDAIELDVDTKKEYYEATAMDLSRHCFWNTDNRYGLFGILEKEYDELYDFPEVAVKSDANISYDMEYSVFMDHYADELIEEQLNGQC